MSPAKVTADGIETAYSESGYGEPVILIHGAESARTQYDTFRPLLGERIRAIAYDQRDTGDTINPQVPYRMEDLARDCANLIRGLGYDKAHVFGSSYGGAVALQLAVIAPEVVRTLTAGATFAGGIFESGPAAELSVLDPGQRAQKMLDMMLSPAAQESQEVMAEISTGLMRRPADADKRRFDALDTYDVSGRLGEISAPTLLIYGADDPLARPDIGRRIADAIPGARFEVIPNVRHAITLEARAVTAGLLRDFVLAHPIDTGA
jgi:pimeloyl-ACP methyl ester carboxylesterase